MKSSIFKIGDVEYTAYWKDIVATYEEDQKTEFRLTKLTFSSVYPKPLQRQNTKLVSQVFNDKTVTAMTTLQQKLIISEGSIKWIKMITQWYKMTSVKSKYIASRLNDEYRGKWTKDWKSFVYLSEICNTVSTLRGSSKQAKKTNERYWKCVSDYHKV